MPLSFQLGLIHANLNLPLLKTLSLRSSLITSEKPFKELTEKDLYFGVIF
jgi:hypothetical protein